LLFRSKLCRLYSKRVNLLNNLRLHLSLLKDHNNPSNRSRLSNLKVNLNNPNNLNRLNSLNNRGNRNSRDNLNNPVNLPNRNNRLSHRLCPDLFGERVAFSARAGASWLS
jgi:hypothetical protein